MYYLILSSYFHSLDRNLLNIYSYQALYWVIGRSLLKVANIVNKCLPLCNLIIYSRLIQNFHHKRQLCYHKSYYLSPNFSVLPTTLIIWLLSSGCAYLLMVHFKRGAGERTQYSK